MCQPEFDIEALTDRLLAESQSRERTEIERLQAMLALFESDTCLTRRLAEYFGDDHFEHAETQACGQPVQAAQGCGQPIQAARSCGQPVQAARG